MAIRVIFEGKAKPERVDLLTASLPKMFPETRAYDGCLGISAHINNDEAPILVFIEQWESKAHYERYLAWRTETGVLEKLGRMLQEPPSIRFFDQIEA
jgi:quinol monooxygenase YgiN